MKKVLYVVVPCYNEEEVLKETTKRLKSKLEELISAGRVDNKSRVMYVNDGSKDKTWELIKSISKKEKLFTGISLSVNRGHQNALLAGLMNAKEKADVVISMDADLQDDINAIDEMLDEFDKGSEIVYGVRNNRKKDSFLKRITAQGFYRFMKLMGTNVIYNHADYRLTSKKVLDSFANFKEVNLFLRGMFPLVGYKSSIVYYQRDKRFAGKSKYSLKKMLNFAWDGITSFSVKPIRFIIVFGIVLNVLSFIGLIVTLILFGVYHTFISWLLLLLVLCWLSSIQILFIGIVGEYVGKTYMEVKHRPRYIISEDLGVEKSE
jgi:glycosyltransferase involved in cell wall biosynthesis